MKRRLLCALSLAPVLPAFAHGGARQRAPAKKRQKRWGIAGDARAVSRTITISMLDTMRFVPGWLDIKLGETVRLAVRNAGRMRHELVIGTAQELAEHAALMQRFPGMEHNEPHMAHVDPGHMGRIVWNFNRAGSFEFACLIAGHYEAGMKGVLTVR